MPRLVPSPPWRAAERVDGLIPIRTTSEPIQDVCFVQIEKGGLLVAERTAAWIKQCSDLMTDYVGMEDAGVAAAVRRIANLAIVGFSTIGIAAGIAAQVML